MKLPIPSSISPMHPPQEHLKLPEAGFSQRITAQQIHLRLSCGSIHGLFCSNIELGGLTWALLPVPHMCIVEEQSL